MEEARDHTSPKEKFRRFRLFEELAALPQAKFEQVEFSLDMPSELRSSFEASIGIRTGQLLRWAESPSGPGLNSVMDILDLVLNRTSNSESHRPEPIDSPEKNQTTTLNESDSEKALIAIVLPPEDSSELKISTIISTVQQIAPRASVHVAPFKEV